MKSSIKFFVILIFTAFTLAGYSQKPEPVYSYVRQIHDFDWYEQQAKAWKQEIDNGTTDNMAWIYWFMANRNAGRFCDYKKWESKIGDYFVPQSKLTEMAEKAIPNTFEYFFIKTYQKDFPGTNSTTEYLLKAQEISPYNKWLFPLLVNHYQFDNDKNNLKVTCQKWFESNEMPQELLITAYNNLISLDSNAVLIVNGDNDTYPNWVMQYGQNVRTDVLVLNLSLAAYNPVYRDLIFKENGIPSISLENDSVNKTQTLCKHLVNSIKNRPVYVSVFTGENEYKGLENKMYFVGLSMKYSEKPFNNLAVLKNNVENKYLLDFLKRSFYNNPSESVCKMINAGYVASFFKLADYYKQNGETVKAKKMKDFYRTIALNSGFTKWLKETDK